MPGGFSINQEICNGRSSLSGPSSKGVSVTATQNAYGSTWTTLIASTAGDTCFMGVRIWPSQATSNRTFTQIGVGAASSEQVIFKDLYASSGTSGTIVTEYLIPCNIPAGTRISARCNNNSAADSNSIQITLYDGGFNQIDGYGGVDSIGFTSASSQGVDVDPGATVNTYGSWVVLTSSTPRDYVGIMIAPGQNVANSMSPGSGPDYISIGIGGTGAEQIIVLDYNCMNSGNSTTPALVPVLPIAIPAGTQIQARIASSNNTAGTRVFGVMLYGVYI